VLQTRTLSVAGLPIDIQPWDDSPAAKRAADLVTAAIDGVDMPSLIAHLMDAVAKGYAVAEIVWDTSGDTWLPKLIAPREAHWFRFDSDTGRILRLVDGSAEGAEIPPYRMIVHAPPVAAGIPLLGGVARSALWAWVFKSYAMRDWARFAELFGQPIRLGKYHHGATPDDVAVLKQAVFSLGSDAAAVIPQEMALELIEAGGKSASADLYHRLIDYLDRQVSKAVLGQTMTTDDGSSLAQAKVHAEVRADILRADARSIAATLTRDLIAPIVRLNMGDDAPLPILTLCVEEPEDMAALADQVVKLSQAGMPIPQWWVRERFGIPEAAEGEPVLGAPALPQDAPAAQAVHALHTTRCGCAAHAQGAPDIPALQADRMEIEAEPAWRAIMAEVQRIVDEAESLPQLRDALLAAFGGLPTEELAQVMAMGFAAAELAGRHMVREESA
jgi:phage gp29-like protein